MHFWRPEMRINVFVLLLLSIVQLGTMVKFTEVPSMFPHNTTLGLALPNLARLKSNECCTACHEKFVSHSLMSTWGISMTDVLCKGYVVELGGTEPQWTSPSYLAVRLTARAKRTFIRISGCQKRYLTILAPSHRAYISVVRMLE